jgi:outer membrane lipoprotein-sorting protein
MMIKIKTGYIIAVLLWISGFCSFQSVAQNAASILDKAASTYEKSNGLTANFTMYMSNKGQKAGTLSGTIDIKGNKFVLKTQEMVTWFNGITQWTYMAQTDEVNVTNPSKEELQTTNPSILLHSYKKGYSPIYKGESTAPNGKAAYTVELLPRKKGDITKVELQIEKYSNFPASILVVMKNGTTSNVHITKMKTGLNQPDSYFVFNKRNYPNAEIVDLR